MPGVGKGHSIREKRGVVRLGAGVWRKEASLPMGDEKNTQLRGPGSVGAAVVKSESETTC